MKTTEELVKDVLGGNMQSFEVLYNDTSKKIYYVCYSFVKNEHDAMDLMQEVYLSALTHLSSLKEPERFTQWISQIAVNKCKDFLTKKVPVLLEEEEMNNIPVNDEELSLPEKYIIDREKRKILMNIMLEKLSAIQYQTVVLYYFNGLSQQEIATCMECPEGTVSYRLSVAREKIKAGVLEYEKKSGEKLYCVAGIPFLAAFFAAEADAMVIPNVFAAIMSGFVPSAEASAAAAATEATGAVAGTVAGAVASETAAKAAEVAVKAAAKTGIKAFFQSAVVKVAAVVLGLAVVGGAGIAVSNAIKDGKEAEVKTEKVSDSADKKNSDVEDKKGSEEVKDSEGEEERMPAAIGKVFINDADFYVEFTYNETAYTYITSDMNSAHFLHNASGEELTLSSEEYLIWEKNPYIMVEVREGITAQEYCEEMKDVAKKLNLQYEFSSETIDNKTVHRIDEVYPETGKIIGTRCIYEREGYVLCAVAEETGGDYSYLEEGFALLFVDARVVEDIDVVYQESAQEDEDENLREDQYEEDDTAQRENCNNSIPEEEVSWYLENLNLTREELDQLTDREITDLVLEWLQAQEAEEEEETVQGNVSGKLTWKEIKGIVNRAINSTGDYQAKYILTHDYYEYNREWSAFDKDYTLIKDIVFDKEKQMSYAKGEWENLVINTWTGTTSSGLVEGYFYPGEYDGRDMTLTYETLFDGTWEASVVYDDFNNIATYYNEDAYFILEEENENEYIISSYLTYSQILEIVDDFSIPKNIQFPIVYTIDKETNKLHHISWKFEYSDSSDLSVEMDMEITPMDDISVVIPEDVILNCMDGRI